MPFWLPSTLPSFLWLARILAWLALMLLWLPSTVSSFLWLARILSWLFCSLPWLDRILSWFARIRDWFARTFFSSLIMNGSVLPWFCVSRSAWVSWLDWVIWSQDRSRLFHTTDRQRWPIPCGDEPPDSRVTGRPRPSPLATNVSSHRTHRPDARKRAGSGRQFGSSG